MKEFIVVRRNGSTTPFNPDKIQVAVTKAFLAVEGEQATDSRRIHDSAEQLTQQVVSALNRQLHNTGRVHIEDIQDQVELALMRAGEHKVARAYVLYREERAKLRVQQQAQETQTQITIIDKNKQRIPLDIKRLENLVHEACTDLLDTKAELIIQQTLRDIYDGIPVNEINNALVMAARTLIEKEPNYSYVASRLLLDRLRNEALGFLNIQEKVHTQKDMATIYPSYFINFIKKGIELGRLDEKLVQFDLQKLGQALQAERDYQFTYLSLQTLYDRYFLHHEYQRFELPQAFFMRVAMGLAINEVDREEKTIEFYDLLSKFDMMCSTPTLFNSGTLRPQLSSCYLTTVPDDLDGIYNAIKDNALLSKYAGGLGNDWSRVRGMGAHIKGTNGKSQGVVPFLKVVNDTAVAVNQCLAADTLIYTNQGIKPIQKIKKGDLVLGQQGRYREVVEHFTYIQNDPMVEINVKHSITPLKITTGHPIFAIKDVPLEQSISRTMAWLEKGKIAPEWIEAGQLKEGDYVAQVIPEEIISVENIDEEDARLYGILLGDGHCSKEGMQWGVSGNPSKDTHLDFVKNYLEKRKIHYWTTQRNEHYMQIHWSSGRGVIKDATTGRIVGAGEPTLPFTSKDLYNAQHKKHIAPHLTHLPHNQTIALIHGLLETDGSVTNGTQVTFSTTSLDLAEGMRYQCLRLGIPVAGQYREREQNHIGTRKDGEKIYFDGVVKSYDLRIPAVSKIAEKLSCQTITKSYWFYYKNWLFTRIRSTKEIIPEREVYDLKVEGDHTYMTTQLLLSNGGKRKGAVCAYLETWHIDIEEFLELRKNTGDERRRTHDMNTANWIPDLFMQRMMENQPWTLFSPDETPELHELTGSAFEAKYLEYEAKAARGELKITKKIQAVDLWRKMLSMLYETGHPWIAFKDPCNIRSPQQHVGVVHSSNLCTEISLPTNDEEIAVCNLSSINLKQHIKDNQINKEKLANTIMTAMRMLDNVIDINYYSVPQARKSNLRHRPVGLGIMGFQDVLHQLRIPYSSEQAVTLSDQIMEFVSFYALKGSCELAKERGAYKTYQGSLWSQGILPIDSIGLLKETRGQYLDMNTEQTLDWDGLRKEIQQYGMRNSNTMAIAPTACVAEDTLILTSEGLIPIATLNQEDTQWQDINLHIFQENKPSLANKLYNNGIKNTLTLVTKRGAILTATPNHRVRVVGEEGEYVWKYLEEITIGDEVIRVLGGHQALLAEKEYISLQCPSNAFPAELTEKVAYLLGLYMGDGYLKYVNLGHRTKKEALGIAIHNDDIGIATWIKDFFANLELTVKPDYSKAQVSQCTVHLAYSKLLVQWFEENHFNKERGNFGEGSASAFIPHKVLQSKSSVLASFLSGLFAADGTASEYHAEFATVSETLAKQVKIALESLGIMVTLSQSNPGSLGKRAVYRVRTSNIIAAQKFIETVGFGPSYKQQRLEQALTLSESKSDQRRGHAVKSQALIIDFIQQARKTTLDANIINSIACAKTNGSLNIYLAKEAIEKAPQLSDTKLGQLLSLGDIYFETITEIIPGQHMTYDLQVPDRNTYLANGFISHNTIANICGVGQSIEPTYQNLFVKSNLSGEFTVVNENLVRDLKALDLWDNVMVNDLKYYDGSVAQIDRIPDDLKQLYATVWEIDPEWLIKAASRRQKWIDQAQSLNIYIANPSGKKLDETYKLAWILGLKTTYYLRARAATHVEKSTLHDKKLNAVVSENMIEVETGASCSSDTDGECESCQ